MFERILRRDDEKWRGKEECLIGDRYLVLLHGFEECRLDFWGSTIDLIGKEDMSKYGSLPYLELACLWAVYLMSCEIGWEEIGSEGDTTIVVSEDIRESLDYLRLSEPWDSLDEDVSACEECDHELADEV